MGGGFQVRTVVVSSFALDGGAMHGIVPRKLWERTHEADASHRIRLVARIGVVESAQGGTRALIDLGLGQRWSAKERGIYAIEQGPDVPEALALAGIDPDTVTHVVLTHLHWDHAGGLVRSGDEPRLAFPRAIHVVGDACLAHAEAPGDKDAGSFRPGDLALLLRDAQVQRWSGGPLAPGLEGHLSDGHTEGLVIPIVHARDDGPPLAFPTDLVPTRSHLEGRWVTAYDNQPMLAVEEKQSLARYLEAIGGGVCLYHDPLVEAAWAVRTARGVELVPGDLQGPAPRA